MRRLEREAWSIWSIDQGKQQLSAPPPELYKTMANVGVVSTVGRVGTVLRLGRDEWSMVIRLRKT